MLKREVIVHPTCKTSYKFIKKLHLDTELYRETILVDAASRPYYALSLGLLSVPAIIVDGIPLYAGPIDLDRAVNLLRNPRILGENEYSIRELAEKIPVIIGDSQALSAILVYNGLEPVLGFENTLKAGLGVWSKDIVEKATEEFINDKELVEKAHRKAVRNLAYNTIRAIYWTYCRGVKRLRDFEEFLSLDHLALLLELSSIYGRIGFVHHRRKRIVEKTRPIYEYIEEKFNKILDYIIREQEEILGDDEYLKILEDKGIRTDYLREFRSSCLGKE